MKTTTLLLALALALSAPLLAQEPTKPEIGTPRVTGAPSLLITPDARSAALGETGLLTADDGFALAHNISALALSEKNSGVGLSFTPWMPDLSKDTNLSMLAGYCSFEGSHGLRHSLAAGVRYFSVGATLAFPKSSRKVYEIRPYELALDLGYALRVHPLVSVGAAVRYYHSEYNISQSGAPGRARTVLGDLGITCRVPLQVDSLPLELTAALAVRNVGGKLTHDGGYTYLFSPATLDLGVAARLRLGEGDGVMIALEGQKLMVPQFPAGGSGTDRDRLRADYYALTMWQAMGRSWTDPRAWKDLTASVALEYAYRGRLFGRAGYRYEAPGRGTGAGFTLGGGFRYRMAQLDLAYFVAQQAHSPLNNTLRLTLGADF